VDQLLVWIADESEAFAATITPDALDARVPGCPEWSLRELAWHLGRVQRFWASDVRVGQDVEPGEFDEAAPGPSDAAELAAWMRASTSDLLDALRTTPPSTPAWTWWQGDRTAGAIARHQVQEAVVHRWDAQSSVGTPASIDTAIADDGVDEFLAVNRQWRGTAPIEFRATDTGSSFSAGEPAIVTVRATASDLVLLLHRRITPDTVEVEGDRAALVKFLVAVA
jgi:uncharacterized protein (TIGR03083 family)